MCIQSCEHLDSSWQKLSQLSGIYPAVVGTVTRCGLQRCCGGCRHVLPLLGVPKRSPCCQHLLSLLGSSTRLGCTMEPWLPSLRVCAVPKTTSKPNVPKMQRTPASVSPRSRRKSSSPSQHPELRHRVFQFLCMLSWRRWLYHPAWVIMQHYKIYARQ